MNKPDSEIHAITVLSLADKLAKFTDHWHPRIIAELNGSHLKLAKLQGEFVWHHHDDGDELFWVLHGTLTMRLRDIAGVVTERTVRPGELIIIPQGVEHMPVAVEEVHMLLIEPTSMLNTGNVRNERTLDELEWV